VWFPLHSTIAWTRCGRLFTSFSKIGHFKAMTSSCLFLGVLCLPRTALSKTIPYMFNRIEIRTPSRPRKWYGHIFLFHWSTYLAVWIGALSSQKRICHSPVHLEIVENGLREVVYSWRYPCSHQPPSQLFYKIAPHYNTITFVLDHRNKIMDYIFFFWTAPDISVGVILKYVEPRFPSSRFASEWMASSP
jgi:hypothetical protein